MNHLSADAPSLAPRADCKYEMVALGASAGGLHAIGAVLAPLPLNFGCGILVVQHLSPRHASMMAELLASKTVLPVHQARDGEPILPGVVYIAPPNHHLLVEVGDVRLLQTPVVHHMRPSVDLLLGSLASSYGPRGIAVVLSGSGSDGADGVRAVKAAGGYVIAEDPDTAEFRFMPDAAIATHCTDRVLPLSSIGKALIHLNRLSLHAVAAPMR
jgi:two-component system chemotaxis response regulator CheB